MFWCLCQYLCSVFLCSFFALNILCFDSFWTDTCFLKGMFVAIRTDVCVCVCLYMF